MTSTNSPNLFPSPPLAPLQKTSSASAAPNSQHSPTKRKRHSMLFKHGFRFSESQRRRRRTISVAIDPISSTSTPTSTPSTSSEPTFSPLPTPPISPSTPFPHCTKSKSTSSSEDDMVIAMPWPLGKVCKKGSRHGRDVGSTSSSTREKTTTTASAPASQGSFNMHPGTLVDFGSSMPNTEYGRENEAMPLSANPMLRIDYDKHRHDHLRIVPKSPQSEQEEEHTRRQSAPEPRSAKAHHRHHHQQQKQHHPVFENIDYKALKHTRRTHSQEQRDRIHRESFTTATYAQLHRSSTSTTSVTTTEFRHQTRTASQSSTSSTSIDAYVSRIRASASLQQAEGEGGEESCKRFGIEYEIFKDERATGWFLADGEVLDSSVRVL